MKKLLKLVLLGTIVLLAYKYFMYSYIPDIKFAEQLGKFLLFVQNLRPGKLYQFVSVWWFLSLLVQLYLLYPVVYVWIKKKPKAVAIVMVLLLLFSALVYKPLLAQKIYVYATPLPNLSIFTLGVWCALGHSIPRCFVISSFIILLPSMACKYVFPFSFVSVVIAFLSFYNKYAFMLLNNKYLLWIGEISMYIFIVHGDFRWHLFKIVNSIKDMYFSYIVFFGYLVEVIAIAYCCSLMMKLTDERKSLVNIFARS